jgi:hypothetical protein
MRCATGKVIFYKERLANRAVTNAAKRGELPTMRHYACRRCGYWHLSRKDRRRAVDT